MEKENILIILLLVLVVIIAIQTFQILTISGIDTSSILSSFDIQQSTMVGGC
ncbi:MAG: hypothetical protein ACE5J4_01315 [Candidatus Aenigmatarchaeota archaeon]